MDSAQQILQRLDARDSDGATLPQALCEACATALPVTGVGIALINERGSQGLVAASDEVAAVLEELQFSLGEGPCVASSVLGRPVLQPQLRETGPAQWPGLGPAALDAGIEAVFAFPLVSHGGRLGALDLYRSTPGMLSADDVAQAQAFGEAATEILLRLQRQTPADAEMHPDLFAPEDDRAEVHQATGVVSVQAAVGLAEALLLLQARAFSEGRDLLMLARDVLDRRVRFEPVTDSQTDERGTS